MEAVAAVLLTSAAAPVQVLVLDNLNQQKISLQLCNFSIPLEITSAVTLGSEFCNEAEYQGGLHC